MSKKKEILKTVEYENSDGKFSKLENVTNVQVMAGFVLIKFERREGGFEDLFLSGQFVKQVAIY